jgi:hypothetical protein
MSVQWATLLVAVVAGFASMAAALSACGDSASVD